MAIRVYVRQKSDRPDLLLYFIDPFTQREVSKTAGTSDRREAERAASRWEQELTAYRGERNDGWKYFRDRFRGEHLAALSDASVRSYGTALNHFQRLMNPSALSEVTPNVVSVFQSKLLGENRPISSIANYLKHLKYALKWAHEIGMLEALPKVKIPRQPHRTFMRGRPLTEKEFKAMRQTCVALCGDDAPKWQRLLDLLWLSGMRIGEALTLSWTAQPIVVELDARPYPRILYYAEGHKARRDDAVPMVPDLAAWLGKTPKRERWGRVIELPIAGQRQIGEQITAFGRAAGIVVNEQEKHASAHDLRRSFGTRWAQKVMPNTLKTLMRHRDIQTTLRYYVDVSSSDAGREIWGGHVPKNVPKTARKRRKAG